MSLLPMMLAGAGLNTTFKLVDAFMNGRTGDTSMSGIGDAALGAVLGGQDDDILSIVMEDGADIVFRTLVQTFKQYNPYLKVVDLVKGIGDLWEGDVIDGVTRIAQAATGFPVPIGVAKGLAKTFHKKGFGAMVDKIALMSGKSGKKGFVKRFVKNYRKGKNGKTKKLEKPDLPTDTSVIATNSKRVTKQKTYDRAQEMAQSSSSNAVQDLSLGQTSVFQTTI